MDRLGDRQRAFNAASRGGWDAFAGHRARLTDALARPIAAGPGAGAGSSRLAVLGAGNANDLDLAALLAAHREVHLVDLDAGALESGAARQGVAGHPDLRRHGGVDLTAALGLLGGWTPATSVGPADLAALADWPAGRAALALPGRFDRVASTCLLTQVFETAAHALGRGHPRRDAVESALLAGHLRLMARLAAPGGEAVLATEVASSNAIPGIADLPDAALAGLLRAPGRPGRFFRAVHSDQLIRAARADPEVGPRLRSANGLDPWRWRLHDRTYLVAAVAFRFA